MWRYAVCVLLVALIPADAQVEPKVVTKGHNPSHLAGSTCERGKYPFRMSAERHPPV
jgi:hypothetical protein